MQGTITVQVFMRLYVLLQKGCVSLYLKNFKTCCVAQQLLQKCTSPTQMIVCVFIIYCYLIIQSV